MVLLWTNPSPMAGYSAQTIPLDLTNYDKVLIVFRFGKETDKYSSEIVEKGYQSVLSAPHISSSGGNFYRYVTLSDNGIVVGQGSQGGVGEVNTACTPYKIYGIRA